MSNPRRHHSGLFGVIGAGMLISPEGNQKGNQKLLSPNGDICKLLKIKESGRSAAW